MSDLSLRERKRARCGLKVKMGGRRKAKTTRGGKERGEKERWKPPESFGTVDRFNWLSRSGLGPLWQATTSLDSSPRQVQ